MQKLLPVLLAATLATPAFAEEMHYNLLQFQESAAVTVANDTMTVILKVEQQSPSRQTAADTVTRRLNAVLARSRAGGKMFKTETLGRNVYPVYDNNNRIKGWQDSARLRIESSDFAALSKLIADSQNEAMPAGLHFSVSPQKHAQAVEQAAEKALQSFRQRAQTVSRSLGFSGYKIVRISLNESFESHAEYSAAAPVPMAAAYAQKHSAPVMDTEPGEQEIRQTVNGTVQMQ